MSQNVFRFSELKYYGFGLYVGLRNLLENGIRLGLKKTVGKIAQPINSYTRFPEYFLTEQAIVGLLAKSSTNTRLKILDVGSPKLFGLYLAWRYPVDLYLTDISPLNADEYSVLWDCVSTRAKGRVQFHLQDARQLGYPSSTFSAVYSMSVIEHVTPEDGDARAVRELGRVVRPGGLLVLSMPYGDKFCEQHRSDFGYLLGTPRDGELRFFQRIYDRVAIRQRILPALEGFSLSEPRTIWRSNHGLAQTYARLGRNVCGALGFLNPLLSLAINRARDGLVTGVGRRYGRIYSPTDIYGDAVLAAFKGH